MTIPLQHDLWLRPGLEAGPHTGDSLAKLLAVMGIADDLGIDVTTAQVWHDATQLSLSPTSGVVIIVGIERLAEPVAKAGQAMHFSTKWVQFIASLSSGCSWGGCGAPAFLVPSHLGHT
jgi:hypothetical protein